MFDEHRELVVIDTRQPLEFALGHVRNAVNVPLDGRFAEQAGVVVAADASVLLTGTRASCPAPS